MAQLNVTYNGQQGDLPDPVGYDLTDQQILDIVRETLPQGIPGIDPVPNPDLYGWVVDRIPAHPQVPVDRILVRPKTPFG